jgi:hypothetical protein
MSSKASPGMLEIQISSQAGYANLGQAVGNAREAFETLGTMLSDSLEPFRKKVQAAAASADEMELKLQLALKGEGKWIVVSASAEASVSVKILWKRKS